MIAVIVAALVHRRRSAHQRAIAASAQPEEGPG
jgi:hypothetical protein